MDYSARQVGQLLGLKHQEVIRRIRRKEIKAKKVGWFWIISEAAVEEAKKAPWYKRLNKQA